MRAYAVRIDDDSDGCVKDTSSAASMLAQLSGSKK